MFTYIDVSAIDKVNGSIVDAKVLRPSEAPSRARKIVHRDDVIYSCVRPYLLNVAIIESDYDPKPIASTAFAILNGHGFVLPRYLWILLRSPFMVTRVEQSQRGQAYPAINDGDFVLLPCPLPPLAEQHRIVAKVDELMNLCDKLEKARTNREDARDRLTKASLGRLSTPDTDRKVFRTHAQFAIHVLPKLTDRADQIKQLRQTILNLAVRGKLVEQDPEDEPASELLKRISAEKSLLVRAGEIRKPRELTNGRPHIEPFEIPSSWRWCTLNTIGVIVGGGTPSTTDAKNFTKAGNGIPWLTPADLGRNSNQHVERGVRDLSTKGLKSSSATLMPAGTVLFTSRAPIGYVAIATNPISTNQGFKSIVPYVQECSRFIALVMRAFGPTINANASGTTFKEVSGRIIACISFPLPPLAEQHRIITKVDELMRFCDQLEKTVATVDITRYRLLEFILHEALMPTV